MQEGQVMLVLPPQPKLVASSERVAGPGRQWLEQS